MEDKLNAVLIEKLLLPLILGIVGWFVKDFLFSVYSRRNELVRKEWEKRLLEIWCPLYYWSGIMMLSGNEKGWERHGLKEVEAILTRSAYILPIEHYINLIKLMQILTGQETAEPRISDLKSTRDYIYNQIKTLNYLLYRRSGWFEVSTYTDFFASAKYLVRFTSQALKHIVVWIMVVALLSGTYLAYVEGIYWIVIAILISVSVPILYDWYKQIELNRVIKHQR